MEETKQIKTLACSDFEISNRQTCHFFSTRHGGISTGNYATANMGEHCGDNLQNVNFNKRLLCNKFGIEAGRLNVPREVHGCQSLYIDSSFLQQSQQKQVELLSSIDALITKEKETAVAVTTADCVPVLLHAENLGLVAAIHAGWRGISQGIIAKTIEHICQREQTTPHEAGFKFLIGPCIAGENYEVGIDVWQQIAQGFTAKEQELILKKKTGDKFYPSLATAAFLQASEFTTKDNIFLQDTDTFTSPLFYSVRRDGQNTGRFLSGIFLKESTLK